MGVYKAPTEGGARTVMGEVSTEVSTVGTAGTVTLQSGPSRRVLARGRSGEPR